MIVFIFGGCCGATFLQWVPRYNGHVFLFRRQFHSIKLCYENVPIMENWSECQNLVAMKIEQQPENVILSRESYL